MKLIKQKHAEVVIADPTIVSGDDGTQVEFYKFDCLKTPMVFRAIDKWQIRSIFKELEYDLPFGDFYPKLILDCGGNIGSAAVYFANVYPDAKIISVEPDVNNFRLLKLNTSPYPKIECINAALWNRATYIELFGAHPASFKAYETNADNPDAIKTTTVGKLLADSGFDEIDLLKIDIEGSEKEVFEASDVDDWLSKVKVLVIELHDRYKRGCSRALFRATLQYDFFCTQRGENLIFVREELLN